MVLKHFPGSVWNYTKSEIEEARSENRLLNCDIEVSRKCNLHCKFCYSDSGKQLNNEMTLAELKELIDDVKNLGAKTVTLTGGEPLMYPGFFELVEHITGLGMKALFFTNATFITPAIAKQLIDNETYPCVSLEAADPTIHDNLVGTKGAFEKTIEGINNLVSVGYTGKLPLTINAVVTKLNIDNLPALWEYAVKRNIDPFFLRLISKGRTRHHNELYVSSDEIKKLVEDIASLKNYEPSVPFLGEEGCVKHYISCHIDSQGFVQPCSGVDIHCGNIRYKNLPSIINDSPIFKIMRNIDSNIQGKCKDCVHHDKCYGCRGVTYALTGDLVGSDPLCWNS